MARSLRRLLSFAILCGVGGFLAAQPANEPAVRVDLIKYQDLGKLVARHKGKIVVVDFWADFCLPCKREFPHLVQLEARYPRAVDVVAISVALDPASAEKRAAVAQFLAKQKADRLINVQLDEQPEVWQKKLGVDGPPCVFVFNRNGGIAGRWEDKVDYAEIDKAIAELIKK